MRPPATKASWQRERVKNVPSAHDGTVWTFDGPVAAVGLGGGRVAVAVGSVNETDGVTPSILVSRDPAPAGLPVETSTPGASYAELRAKAGK